MKTLLYNAKVYVEKGNFAQAVLVEDGIIRKVGTNQEVMALSGKDTETVDCEGRTVIPGFNDTHLHLAMFGEFLNQARIGEAASIGEMIQICREFIKQHPDRVKNGLHAVGWNQDLFEDGHRLPGRADLDRISTGIPIVLERVCGHMMAVNSRVLELLEADGGLARFPEWEVMMGEDGRPSGILTENAGKAARDLIAEPDKEMRKKLLLDAMEYAAAHGITSVQSNDAGTVIMDTSAAFQILHEIYDEGRGKIRYRHQTAFDSLKEFQDYLEKGEFACGKYDEDSWLTLGPLKLFKDGSLGARTAQMKDGYVGDRANHGQEWMSREELEQYCRLAKAYGVQTVTHVIGDKAAAEMLDCYSRIFQDPENKRRHALIHCQITNREILERIKEEKILVFAQPVFLDADMKIVEELCGKELASTSYAFGTLLRNGVHLSYGTDCPVEDCNPFVNLYMAVTRKDKEGRPEGGFYPSECVDVETAVDAYTLESAYAEFMEDRKGRIREGYYADMVVLDADIFTVDVMKMKDILPVLTMTGGKTVYRSKAF